MDNSLTLTPGESSTGAIKRQSVDKVLLARKFSERTTDPEVTLTKKSQEGITRLLDDILEAWRGEVTSL